MNIVPDANPDPGFSQPAQIYAFAQGGGAHRRFAGAREACFLPIDNRWNSDSGFQLLSDQGKAVFDAAVNWAAFPFFLSPTMQNANLNLSWIGGLGGTLQYSDTVKGPWIDIPDASSPHPVPLTEASRFFRIKR